MTVRGITATVSQATDQRTGKVAVSIGKTIDPLVAAQTIVGLTTTTVGGMTTAQITTVQAQAVQLSTMLGNDVFLSFSKSTITTQNQFNAAVEKIEAVASGSGDLT